MRFPLDRRTGLALGLIGAVFSLSCSDVPLAPTPTPETTIAVRNPQFVRVPGPATGKLSPQSTSNSDTARFVIDGGVGGTAKYGRYTIIVPPGAYPGVAEIRIRVPDPTVLVYELDISPSSSNQFALPITLVTDISDAGLTYEQLVDLGVLLLNESSSNWQPVKTAQVDPATATVHVQHEHFSTYGIALGRNGW